MASYAILSVRQDFKKDSVFTSWVYTDQTRTTIRLFPAREDAIDYLCDSGFDFDMESNTFIRRVEHILFNLYIVRKENFTSGMKAQNVR